MYIVEYYFRGGFLNPRMNKKSDKVVPMRKELQKDDGYDYGF